MRVVHPLTCAPVRFVLVAVHSLFADHVSAIRRRLGALRLEQLPRRLGPLRTCRQAELAQKYVQAYAWRFCDLQGVLWPALRVQMHCNT